MKYNFDLTFDDKNIPCFKYPEHISTEDVDSLIDEHIIYVQEYKLNLKKQFGFHWDYKPLLAGLMVFMFGRYVSEFDIGWWSLPVSLVMWVIFFRLVDKQ